MKRALLILSMLSFVACDWADAERRARCTQSPSSCADGGAVTVDAGDDAGASDAGTLDSGATDSGTPDAGTLSVFFSANDPSSVRAVGLYPASNSGVWVVGNVDDRVILQLRDVQGRLVRDLGFIGVAHSAYSDPRGTQSLALLRDNELSAPELVVFSESGTMLGPVTRTGSIVSMYVDTQSRVSVWDTDLVTLTQHLYTHNGALTLQQSVGPAACDVDFTDLEVLPPEAGGAVAMVYFTTSCTAGTVTEGLAPSRSGGVMTITPSGTRSAVNTADMVSIGGVRDGGLGFLSRINAANIAVTAGAWNDGGVSLQQVRTIGAADGLRAGDVHDGVMTFHARGSVLPDVTANVNTMNLPDDAVVATVSPWSALVLGKTNDSRMPVLRVNDELTWVLWAPADGGLQLTNLSLQDGGFVVR